MQELRLRLTREQYEWVSENAEIECEGNKAQFIRKLIEKGRSKANEKL